MTTESTPQPAAEPIPTDKTLPVRTASQRLLAIVLILLFLIGGALTARMLILSKPKAERRVPPKMQRLVEIEILARRDVAPALEAMGTVVPARELSVKPEVSGTVASLSPNLIPGGFVARGETLLTIDQRDYALALERSRLALEKAIMDVRLEEGSQNVARREYELIRKYAGDTVAEASEDLALRKPQLAKTKAAEADARVAWEQAKLDLDRTVVKAPFDALVLSRDVALGAQVNSQSAVASLVGTDAYWVRITLPQEQLARIDLATAAVRLTSVNTPDSVPWTGRILRLLGDVDPRGLMARLLIQVDSPLTSLSGRSPLLLGSVVRAGIEAESIVGCYPIPRQALQPDNTVLIAAEDDTLDIRPVDAVWQDRDWIYVREGLSDGERLIVSDVPAPIQGMPLALRGQKKEGSPGPQDGDRRRAQ